MKSKRNMKLIPLIISTFLFSLAGPTLAQYDIPSPRRITWNPGVDNGIPIRTTLVNCKDEYGVAGDGSSDDTTKIRNCISGTPSGQVAYLPAGTYKITGMLTINKSITLRGSGISSTIITNDSSGLDSTVSITGGDYSQASGISIVSGYTKGSTQLVLSNASSISVGNFIRVDELNDLL